MLTEKQIKKFQIIYKNRFGVEISQDEALDKGIKLIRMIKMICEPENSSKS